MKTTAERLVNSYCIPKSHEDWDAIYPQAKWLSQYPSSHSHVFYVDGGKYLASYPNENSSRTQIPVQHFIDLIEDKIVAWRLEKDELFTIAGIFAITKEIDFDPRCNELSVCGITRKNVRTYSDLLTLIRFLK